MEEYQVGKSYVVSLFESNVYYYIDQVIEIEKDWNEIKIKAKRIISFKRYVYSGILRLSAFDSVNFLSQGNFYLIKETEDAMVEFELSLLEKIEGFVPSSSSPYKFESYQIENDKIFTWTYVGGFMKDFGFIKIREFSRDNEIELIPCCSRDQAVSVEAEEGKHYTYKICTREDLDLEIGKIIWTLEN